MIMAIFKRMTDMVTASINELLDGIEDPVATVNQMIREMENSIQGMRQQTASAIASQKVLQKKRGRLRADVRQAESQAAAALDNKDEDGARCHLRRKQEFTAALAKLKIEEAELATLVTELKSELSRLEDRVQETRSKRDTLLVKKRALETREKMQAVRRGTPVRSEMAPSDVISGFDALNKLEDELDQMEAMHEAEAEVDALRGRVANSATPVADPVEAELADLKKRRGAK
jgi:phage shock protein A